jgi:hypothetical protein
MTAEEFEHTPPFTDKFDLDNPAMIDLELLSKTEKEKLLRDLQKRQGFASREISWTGDHVKLLLKLQAELSENKTDSYVPEKDKPFYKR